MRDSCLDDNAIAALLSGDLAGSRRAALTAHIDTCHACRALVADLVRDEDPPAEDPPQDPDDPGDDTPHGLLLPNARLGRYVVEGTIGAGAMGVVYAAFDPELGRRVALKLLRPDPRTGAGGDAARTRLLREAQVLAKLTHPNVVAIYDVGTLGAEVFLAMELVEGGTLAEWLAKRRTWRDIVRVFLQIGAGLAAAHAAGLVHRDLKPDNILVGTDGRARVTDFGLSRVAIVLDDAPPPAHAMPLDHDISASGALLGTPAYMAPEQLARRAADAASDQFSFCVALYEALYGCHPLRDGTSLLMLEHGDKAMPPPEGGKIPALIGRTLLRGLERDRVRRFPSMAALMEQLVPVPRRSTARYAMFGLAAVVLVGGSTAAMFAQQPHPAPVTQPDQAAFQKLIAQKEHDLQELRDQLRSRTEADQLEIRRLADQLREKEVELDALVATVARLEARTRTAKAAAGKLGKPPIQPIRDALAGVQSAVTACFDEWAQRNAGTRDEVAEATLVIGLTVTADGQGTMERIISTPDKHPPNDDGVPGRSMLEFCVSEQIAGAHFSPGPEPIDLEVAVQWSPGQVHMMPIVHTHPSVP
ncbi:MAG TPA: serine/threonine-protein kinase [Kofleriaceae bacterium]|nr:serine/threonine-protein kinase [Kofleriaceae bacterium]